MHLCLTVECITSICSLAVLHVCFSTFQSSQFNYLSPPPPPRIACSHVHMIRSRERNRPYWLFRGCGWHFIYSETFNMPGV